MINNSNSEQCLEIRTVKCLIVQEAIDLLYSDELDIDDDVEGIDMVNIPLDDDLSDEDEVDDDNFLSPMV